MQMRGGRMKNIVEIVFEMISKMNMHVPFCEIQYKNPSAFTIDMRFVSRTCVIIIMTNFDYLNTLQPPYSRQTDTTKPVYS